MTTEAWDGERLIPGDSLLGPHRTENLAKFHFFRGQVAGGLILDMGCGAGEGTAFLSAQPGWQVVGVDVDFKAVAIAQDSGGSQQLNLAQMDVKRLGFASGIFDGIISAEVVEHLDDPLPYLAEAQRLLKPGGLFLLTTPNQIRSSPTPGSIWPAHIREYTPGELRELLERFFSSVQLWGEMVPVYEQHPLRRLVRKLAPFFKPRLPHALRIRALPFVENLIRSKLQIADVAFVAENDPSAPHGLDEFPTLVAICRV